MEFFAALAILESIRGTPSYLSPADVANAMEITLLARGMPGPEVGRHIGHWYGLLYKGRERLLAGLLDNSLVRKDYKP